MSVATPRTFLLVGSRGCQDATASILKYSREQKANEEIFWSLAIIKIETDPKRGEKVFEQAIKILQLEKPPEASPDCEFCKWEANVTLKVQ